MTGFSKVLTGLTVAALLTGCGSARLFDAHPLAESDTASGKAWPRLVDTPDAPAKGGYSASVPDPAHGEELTAELSQAAQDAAVRAEPLQAPVLTEAERRRLTGKP
ncbi:MAG: hypothetical protein OEN23_01065 [Paracoccaceae bacterium]|nr:hypothetical protein [Paracoccaceae bacterium]